ncbi:MAG: hypothetical protein EAZ32_14245 [Cytophagia bacterium]|nr:MAG: hypothetical protein EAZ46_09045 [Runella sp.]TAG18292.1 MAG: hypothetical protein EAZ38_15250 [Cytophagales bacterium]TAG37795.1 MAG: hypothetical protein EAZ32_14245 [Cytophagia bacterium]TAG79028.1 MAG: hypothetical protein EAZ22_12385 [Cytophagales bacterium]
MKKNIKTILTLLTFSLWGQGAFAQKAADIQAIKGQCGCHEVDFKYAETFSPQKDYKYSDRYTAKALEWVFVDEESKDKLVLMHLLVINDKTVIKHWREDWEYEQNNLLAYQKNKDWKAAQLPKNQVKGQWAQKIFEVDDSPRYEGSASWIHQDGKHLWANVTDAPLPRREYTKRTDYQVLRRNNRIYVTSAGYLHEQDNDKIVRTETGDQLLAQEKGINDYVRTEESKCDVAKRWWTKHRTFWADVRGVWSELIAQNKGISLKTDKVDGKHLGQILESLSYQSDTPATRQDIRAAILKFVNNAELYSMR